MLSAAACFGETLRTSLPGGGWVGGSRAEGFHPSPALPAAERLRPLRLFRRPEMLKLRDKL